MKKLIKKVSINTIYDQLLDHAKSNKMGDIITWLELAKKFDGTVDLAEMDPSENTAWVKYPFVLAIMFMMKKNLSYSQAIRETLMYAGDTCVNAMMVGAIMGARLGLDHLPTEPIYNIENCDMTKYKGDGSSRPDVLQPAKVLKNLFEKLNNRSNDDVEVDTRLRADHHYEIIDQSIMEKKEEPVVIEEQKTEEELKETFGERINMEDATESQESAL